MTDLSNAAETAITQCLGLQSDEAFVVVTDPERESIAEACATAAETVTEDVVRLTYPVGEQHGEEPPKPVAGALQSCDAFLAPTTKSISHTAARKQATDNGARGATLPGITEDVFVTGMQGDYTAVRENCQHVFSIVSGAETLTLTTPAGTDLTFQLDDRTWHQDTGDVTEAGSFANLPAGEVYISPVSAEGTLVIDGSMRPHGLLDGPVTFTIEDGFVVDVDDEDIATMLAEASETAQKPQSPYNIAELGIGTNPAVTTLSGNILLDEKAKGTAHVAVGHDKSMGGDVVAPIHEDGVLKNPTIHVDGTEERLWD